MWTTFCKESFWIESFGPRISEVKKKALKKYVQGKINILSAKLRELLNQPYSFDVFHCLEYLNIVYSVTGSSTSNRLGVTRIFKKNIYEGTYTNTHIYIWVNIPWQ